MILYEVEYMIISIVPVPKLILYSLIKFRKLVNNKSTSRN